MCGGQRKREDSLWLFLLPISCLRIGRGTKTVDQNQPKRKKKAGLEEGLHPRSHGSLTGRRSIQIARTDLSNLFPIPSLDWWWCCSDPTLSTLPTYFFLQIFPCALYLRKGKQWRLIPPFFSCPSKECAVIDVRSLIHVLA